MVLTPSPPCTVLSNCPITTTQSLPTGANRRPPRQGEGHPEPTRRLKQDVMSICVVALPVTGPRGRCLRRLCVFKSPPGYEFKPPPGSVHPPPSGTYLGTSSHHLGLREAKVAGWRASCSGWSWPAMGLESAPKWGCIHPPPNGDVNPALAIEAARVAI